jgi:hypothetical protein
LLNTNDADVYNIIVVEAEDGTYKWTCGVCLDEGSSVYDQPEHAAAIGRAHHEWHLLRHIVETGAHCLY